MIESHPQRKCANCKFAHETDTSMQRYCRRYPPAIAGRGEVNEFPRVNAHTHWCGEFAVDRILHSGEVQS